MCSEGFRYLQYCKREWVEENGNHVFSCTVKLCSEIIPTIKIVAFVCGRASDVNKDEPRLSHVYLEGAAAFLKLRARLTTTTNHHVFVRSFESMQQSKPFVHFAGFTAAGRSGSRGIPRVSACTSPSERSSGRRTGPSSCRSPVRYTCARKQTPAS